MEKNISPSCLNIDGIELKLASYILRTLTKKFIQNSQRQIFSLNEQKTVGGLFGVKFLNFWHNFFSSNYFCRHLELCNPSIIDQFKGGWVKMNKYFLVSKFVTDRQTDR